MSTSRSKLSALELQDMATVFEVLDLFTALERTMTHLTVKTFLLVAMDEGKSLVEYAQRASVSKSVMSHHISDLGPYGGRPIGGKRRPGLKLVASHENLDNRQEKQVWLTPTGRALVQRILRRIRRGS